MKTNRTYTQVTQGSKPYELTMDEVGILDILITDTDEGVVYFLIRNDSHEAFGKVATHMATMGMPTILEDGKVITLPYFGKLDLTKYGLFINNLRGYFWNTQVSK